MSKTGRSLLAVSLAAAVLLFATWFDHNVLNDARRQMGATFEIGWTMTLMALGTILVAAFALLVAVLAWRAASPVVGVAYALVGGFLVALPWLVWTLAAKTNDRPPALPEPIAAGLGNLYFSTTGSLNAVEIIGGAMLVAGIASLARSRSPSAGTDWTRLG